MFRNDVAIGKALAAVGMGAASRTLLQRAKENPQFFGALASIGRAVHAADRRGADQGSGRHRAGRGRRLRRHRRRGRGGLHRRHRGGRPQLGWAAIPPANARNWRAVAVVLRSEEDIMQIRKGTIGYMLAHEQFPVHELREIGTAAARCGFGLLATSDHFQPWQANEGHAGEAWVTLARARTSERPTAWMGTTVTCPTLRYQPGDRSRGLRLAGPAQSRPDLPGCRFGRGVERAGRDR